jgi:hypothetical protein
MVFFGGSLLVLSAVFYFCGGLNSSSSIAVPRQYQAAASSTPSTTPSPTPSLSPVHSQNNSVGHDNDDHTFVHTTPNLATVAASDEVSMSITRTGSSRAKTHVA